MFGLITLLLIGGRPIQIMMQCGKEVLFFELLGGIGSSSWLLFDIHYHALPPSNSLNCD